MTAPRALAGLVRHGTFPLLAFGPSALVLTLLGPSATAHERPSSTVLAASAAIIVSSYGLLAVLERLFPHRDDWNRPKDDLLADLAYFVALAPASALLGGTLASLLVDELHRVSLVTLRLEVWPGTWPPFLQVFLACWLADLATTGRIASATSSRCSGACTRSTTALAGSTGSTRHASIRSI